MKSQKADNRVPDWKLERYLLDELDPEERESIRKEIESNPVLGEKLEDIRRSDRRILERYPASLMARSIQNKMKKPGISSGGFKSVSRSRFWPVPAIPAVAVIILLVILPTVFPPGVDESGEMSGGRVTRIKGDDARLHLFRKTETGSEHMENGSVAREKDLILVQYQGAGKEYGTILSIDGRGTVSQHFPGKGRQAGRLEKEGPVTLDFAYELDDAPRWETFYFITSDSAFEIEPVIQAARRSVLDWTGSEPGTLDLPDRFEQYLFTLKKEENDDS